MNINTFKKYVKKFGGWIENHNAYFPTVHQREQFEKAVREYEEGQK